MTAASLHDPARPDDDACYLALKAHDARFDGLFFTGVTSTGVYCRPVCRVRLPKRENCRFFAHAAQAEGAGFRPCLRCRPELSPRRITSDEALQWSSEDASRVLALQAARWLDEHAGQAPSMMELSGKLGVSDRHLRRLFEAELGVSPLQYLQTRRLLNAKQLLSETHLPVSDVALSSGFDSVRRFNAAFVSHYGLNPSQLRKAGSDTVGTSAQPHATDLGVTLKLAYRAPYDTHAMVGFLAERTLIGVDEFSVSSPALPVQNRASSATQLIADNAHSVWAKRSFGFKDSHNSHHKGWLALRWDEQAPIVHLQVSHDLCAVLPQIVTRVRRWLDLDADPLAIDAVLAGDFPGSAGLRVPGCLDGFELAVRAVLGQQITVKAARTLAQRLVERFGEPITTPFPAITHLFPSAERLAQASPDALGQLGIVKQRQAAILALARAVAGGTLDLNQSFKPQETMAQLVALPGIGAWTASYIAMRALRWPDAFPAGDIALHNVFKLRAETNPARACEALSQRWRPWRSYAVIRAWHRLQESG
jgi:AraC family transcriptional regulator, regulatory protein of adaptative response / DNA-3-methyladenine glycosylase II